MTECLVSWRRAGQSGPSTYLQEEQSQLLPWTLSQKISIAFVRKERREEEKKKEKGKGTSVRKQVDQNLQCLFLNVFDRSS